MLAVSFKVKFSERLAPDARKRLVRVLARDGLDLHPLFPRQRRPKLASIYEVSAGPGLRLADVRRMLAKYDDDVDYVEGAVKRAPAG